MSRPSPLQLALYGAVGAVMLLLLLRSGGEGSGSIGTEAGAEIRVAAEGGGGRGGGSGAGRGGVVVHVAGAVRKPGVYEVEGGARVADAIERAGGLEGKANPDGINLAARVADGQQLVVPSEAPARGATASGATASGADSPISLGSATAAELETIDGVGPVTAGKIIEHRDSGAPITSLQDLDAISGVGPATIASLEGSLQP